MEAVQIQAYGNPVRVAMAVDVAGDGRVIRFNERGAGCRSPCWLQSYTSGCASCKLSNSVTQSLAPAR